MMVTTITSTGQPQKAIKRHENRTSPRQKNTTESNKVFMDLEKGFQMSGSSAVASGKIVEKLILFKIMVVKNLYIHIFVFRRKTNTQD